MKNLPLVANKQGICSRNININAIWSWAENTVNSGVLLHFHHQTLQFFGEPPVPTVTWFTESNLLKFQICTPAQQQLSITAQAMLLLGLLDVQCLSNTEHFALRNHFVFVKPDMYQTLNRYMNTWPSMFCIYNSKCSIRRTFSFFSAANALWQGCFPKTHLQRWWENIWIHSTIQWGSPGSSQWQRRQVWRFHQPYHGR